ncbi:MAG: phosphoenolpyruvate--protein phosphotransferase [Desulfobacterales bacterium]
MIQERHGHLNLLYNIGELSNLIAGSGNIESFLQKTVSLVSKHLKAHVCSIYLYEGSSQQLVLKSTTGLNSDAVGQIRMNLGEGLAGLSLARLHPVNEGDASHNPHYKYFPEAGEERFNSFLAVPIHRGIEKIGVLVVQHEKNNFFDELDVLALKTLASQLAGAIENAQSLMEVHRTEKQPAIHTIPENLRFIKAEVSSSGYAFAPAKIFDRSHDALLVEDPIKNASLTIQDFHRAIQATVNQLKSLQKHFAAHLPESASLIFSAHFMILKDPSFVGGMVKLIENGVAPSEAVREMNRKYISIFSSSSHAYIREKVNDVEDLALRILKNLFAKNLNESVIRKKRIIIARDLYPSDILKFASEKVKGILFVSGSITSHIAILSRSLQIPLMIADRSELLNLPDGTPVLMDAEIGSIYIRPSKEVIHQFEARNKARKKAEPLSLKMSSTTHTRDGTQVHLQANINLLSEVAVAKKLKAEGIGLYRTEFPFLIRSIFPSEEEQVEIYKRLIKDMNGKSVTIRTLDIGGDKVLSYSDATGEANPQLGCRSIRFSLKHRDIFQQQIRAILRASAETGKVRIMFPMISSLDEFTEAKTVVQECIEDLAEKKLPHPDTPEIGMMVELPSVLEIMDEFVQTADFFSIGTNDFIQFMLAVDRTNIRVADYYQPWHPSVLRGLSKIVSAVLKGGKEVSVCGEMARDLSFIPFLIGIGVRTLSLDPQFLPPVQHRISELNLIDAENFALDLLSQATIKGVKKIVNAA